MSIFTPINQVKLTNVSVVRLKRSGKRFELACYKNKVLEWRQGITKDLDEVLQTHSIFTNVSKGLIAGSSDLKAAFGPELAEQSDKIVLEILKKGEIQVTERERTHQLDQIIKDIANIVTDKCVNPETNRPYPSSVIEKAITDLHISFSLQKNSKQQALEVIKMLQKQGKIPITRAQMRLKLEMQSADAKALKEKLATLVTTVENEDWTGGNFEMVCLINPGNFKALTDLVTNVTKGRGTVHMQSLKDVDDSEEIL